MFTPRRTNYNFIALHTEQNLNHVTLTALYHQLAAKNLHTTDDLRACNFQNFHMGANPVSASVSYTFMIYTMHTTTEVLLCPLSSYTNLYIHGNHPFQYLAISTDTYNVPHWCLLTSCLLHVMFAPSPSMFNCYITCRTSKPQATKQFPKMKDDKSVPPSRPSGFSSKNPDFQNFSPMLFIKKVIKWAMGILR